MKNFVNWKMVKLLLVACVFSTVAIFPYAVSLQAEQLAEVPLPLSVLLFLSLVQSTVLYSILIIVGLKAASKVRIALPIFEKYLVGELTRKDLLSIAKASVPAGLLVGIAIIVGDWLGNLFVPIGFPETVAPIWQGALATFYGGVVEEVLVRLFLMSVLVWLAAKIWKTSAGLPTPTAFWFGIIAASILFGLGHLPATALLVDITPFIVFRAIVLNGIGGVVFGWLFWKRGLVAAMLAHFTADVVLQIFLPIGKSMFGG